MCEVQGYPTMKGSDDPFKRTLCGRLQVYRGVGKDGNYVGDVTGLAGEKDKIEIPGAETVLELLNEYPLDYDEFGTAHEQKAQVTNELARLGFLMNYPTMLSPALSSLMDSTQATMRGA
jgi:hypothetical protein